MEVITFVEYMGYNLVFDQFLFEGNNKQQVNQQVTELSQLILDTYIQSMHTE